MCRNYHRNLDMFPFLLHFLAFVTVLRAITAGLVKSQISLDFFHRMEGLFCAVIIGMSSASETLILA